MKIITSSTQSSEGSEEENYFWEDWIIILRSEYNSIQFMGIN